MHVAVVIESLDSSYIDNVPWLFHREELARQGIYLDRLDQADGFACQYDAMIPMVWLDWNNPSRFKAWRILPFMEKYSEYRSRFPEVVQIICNHIDMSRRPYATPYWRKGDPILYRTPAYDRRELAPLPAEDIWPYEMIWGTPCLASDQPPTRLAGFIGSPSGPNGYRQEVARETAKIGIGMCLEQPIPHEQYCGLLSECEVVVCPQGWGGNTLRHWNAWKSGKPVLMDDECAAVEMIPHVRLQAGVHYLAFHAPAEIPDIVADWTRPDRRDDLRQIAENGRAAAYSYDGLADMVRFFRRVASEYGHG